MLRRLLSWQSVFSWKFFCLSLHLCQILAVRLNLNQSLLHLRHFPAHIEDYLATGSQRSSSLNKAGEIAAHHPPLHPPAANAMTNCHDQVYSKTSTFPASKILPIPSEPEARETVEKSDGSSACTRSAFLSTSKSICVANLPREADTLWVYER